MSKTKKIKLRAFFFKNDVGLSQSSSNLIKDISSKCLGTKADDRKIPLNPSDPTGEADILSDFKFLTVPYMFGTILRIIPNGDHAHIDQKLFEKETFSEEEIEKSTKAGHAVLKQAYHIMMSDAHLVTDLPRPKTIKNTETYLNELLGIHTLQIFPIVQNKPDLKLSDVKQISFSGGKKLSPEIEKTLFQKLDFNQILSYLFDATSNQKLSDIQAKEFISAQLIVKFKKPRDMSEQDYQNKFSAILKPMADLEDISIKSKNNKTITASDLLLEEEIEIDVTDSGYISEPDLKTEMARFLDRIKNNGKNP